MRNEIYEEYKRAEGYKSLIPLINTKTNKVTQTFLDIGFLMLLSAIAILPFKTYIKTNLDFFYYTILPASLFSFSLVLIWYGDKKRISSIGAVLVQKNIEYLTEKLGIQRFNMDLLKRILDDRAVFVEKYEELKQGFKSDLDGIKLVPFVFKAAPTAIFITIISWYKGELSSSALTTLAFSCIFTSCLFYFLQHMWYDLFYSERYRLLKALVCHLEDMKLTKYTLTEEKT